MIEAPVPFYSDSHVWSALFAGVAIILSQLPPVKLWLRPRKIEVEVPSRILITHGIGNPNVAVAISLRNTGGRELLIRSIQLKLVRDNKPLVSFPAQNFYETPSSQTPVLFVPFSLKPGETWIHGTNFLNFFDRATEKHYREIESHLREDIQKKLEDKKPDDKHFVEAEVQLVTPFTTLFDKLFIWEPGEYVAELTVDTEPGSATFSKKYRFTLFESDTTELRKHTDDYKFGSRILFPTNKAIGVNIPLTSHEG